MHIACIIRVPLIQIFQPQSRSIFSNLSFHPTTVPLVAQTSFLITNQQRIFLPSGYLTGKSGPYRSDMLDPLTALSLASSIVQLVDFCKELVTDGVELYQKGRLSENGELETATMRLIQLTKALVIPQPSNVGPGMPPEPLSESESNLRRLSGECRVLGAELISKLEAVKADKPQDWVESFRKAARNAKNNGKVQNLEKRLKTLQDQLNLHLLAVLRYVFGH
jgi:hypothetical protein